MSSVPWTRGERWAVTALGLVVAITAAWWVLALWPVPTGAAPWLERTRQVCFGTTETGLPDAGGWLLLVGQPISMVVVLLVVWGRSLRTGIWALGRTWGGRVAMTLAVALATTGAGAAGVRVADALRTTPLLEDVPLAPERYPRLDRPAPALGLVDQHGDPFTLERLRGRPVLVTFAFGHCDAVCPMTVHNAREVARAVADLDPALVVVTLDPWRDRPARLPYLASQWGLEGDQFVLSGDLEAVEKVLDDWDVARERDGRDGNIRHAPLVYVVDGTGRIVYATNGDPPLTAALALRM